MAPRTSFVDEPKILALLELLQQKHSGQKVLLFTQFADTVDYLESVKMNQRQSLK